jgi:hypothetical protein
VGHRRGEKLDVQRSKYLTHLGLTGQSSKLKVLLATWGKGRRGRSGRPLVVREKPGAKKSQEGGKGREESDRSERKRVSALIRD